MQNPREAALFALYEIEYNGAYSNMAVKDALPKLTDSRDKGLVTQLVYGVVRRKLTLDYIISRYSKVKIKKLSKYVLLILRMGVYQLYFTDKIPESAAVNESVKLAKKYCGKSSGFVNGILHSVIRGKDTLEYPKDKIENLSVKYSFTEEMVELFWDTGFCEELLDALNGEPETTVRVNTLKNEELETECEVSQIYSGARILKGTDIANNPDYQKGRIIVQDIAAMMASLALSPKPNDTCIDMCASPGGKTTHLAELMENKGRIYAFDIHPHKIEIINKNAERMGISIIDAKVGDALKLNQELIGKADKVLADVPCSGLGIIRRKPDIKWNKDEIETLPEIQLKILENASKYLKDGGELVYSTCTILRRENEDVVMRFLEENKDFELLPIELPQKLARENKGYITLYPNIDGTDGFFICKVKRKCK
ncbi:MAG: 16S rRNA (cytosine(967)-C(5))-methyltransferase RsmB [Clostridia bacterium]|nr:16S rRNA (cytosine(967)-C(5))-methyltransferase RsmB [Clostridia bacterium]